MLALFIAILNYTVPFFHAFQDFTWLSLVFFIVLTIITGKIGFRSLQKSPYGFVASVNGIVILKLFLGVGFIIAYVLIAKPEGPSFIISFFVLYVFYTVFEIRTLIIAQRKKPGKQKEMEDGQH